MSFWGCEHDWQPSAKSYAAPFMGEIENFRDVRAAQKLMMGATTFVYQCAKCKDLKTVETLGTGEFLKK